MSTNSSTIDNFNVQKWTDAIKKATNVAAEAMLPALCDHLLDLKDDNSAFLKNPSAMAPHLEYGIVFACDIAAPNGTYPTYDTLLPAKRTVYIYMSPDVFACFKKAPSLCMKRFAYSLIANCNNSDRIKSKYDVKIKHFAGFPDEFARVASDVVDTFALQFSVKVTPITIQPAAQVATGGSSFFGLFASSPSQ